MKAFHVYASAAAVGLLIFLLLPGEAWIHDLWQVAFGWSSAATIVISMRQRRPASAAAWFLFALGVFLNASGILLAAILGRAIGPEAIASPAIPDFFWIALYPCLAAGIALLIRRVLTGRDRTTLVDTVIISTALALLSWVYAIRPLASDPTVTLLARMVVVAYPVGDTVLLAMVVRLLLAGGRPSTSLRLLVAALCCFLAADLGWAIVTQTMVTPALWLQRILETITLGGYTLLGAAGLHPSVGETAQPVGPQRPRLGLRLLAGLTVAALVGPILLLHQVLQGRVIDGLPIAISSIVMFLLVVARIVLVNNTLRQEIDTRLRVERELRRAKEEADVASKAKSEFLANMSHEIRTPMNAVIGFGELLRSTPLDDQQRDYVDTIADSGELLISLISDILDLSKIEARTLSLESIDFDLEYLIASVFRILRHRAHSKSLTFTLRMPDEMPRTFKGDPTRIRQIIMNLVGNAIKFTAQGGITVTVRQGDAAPDGIARLEFSVQDTGIGIPADKQRAIFDAFTQVDSSTTREYGGTGLGLTITRSLVEMMGGTIRVNSEVGRGTEFVFDLALQPGEPNIEKEIAPVDVDDLAGKAALIVDDNEHNRAILGRYCEDIRMTVLFSAESVQQALDWLAGPNGSLDVVFTDIRMPGIDGYSFARQVKADERLRHVKLIALTSDALPGSAEYSNRVGFDAFLPKPFRRRDVYEILRAVFGDKRGMRHQIITRHLAHELLTKGIHVLLVEDNPLNQKLMTVLLDKMGCIVEIAQNGQEAVERTATHTFDVVLMDLQMPVMDGFEATETIRGRNGSAMPIVALTARAFKDDEERCRAVGMNDFLTKPIDARALRETLLKWARQ